MSLRSISLLAFALLLNIPTPATAADVVYVSPYNRRTITSHQPLPQQPLQRSLSEKEQQLKAYQDSEDELIKTRAPDAPALTKKEIEAIIDKKMGRTPPPATTTKTPAAKAVENPDEKNFGPVGGLGPIGGIGTVGPN